MTTATGNNTDSGNHQMARANRGMLNEAGVFAISIIGGPGCGKTQLLDETIRRLSGCRRIAVISGDSPASYGPDHICRHAAKVVRVATQFTHCLDAREVHDALQSIDLHEIDLLFIENIGSLTVPVVDLGQDATVTLFSVAAGDDKAAKHHDLIEASDAVILNKTDLLPVVPFDLARFRKDVHAARADVDLFEISALAGMHMESWLKWLEERSRRGPGICSSPSHWFG